MSAKYSGRIHDPNHTAADYDIYFNENLVQTGVNYADEYIGIITRTGTAVTIPDGITEIGGSAFRGMEQLSKVHIPDGVRTIRVYAFGSCRSLLEIYIPSSVNAISGQAFSATDDNIVIKCGFAEGAVAGAPWGASENATVLYDQERPAEATNIMPVNPIVNSGMLNAQERTDVVDDSANIEEA